jgi:hypothetical protein
MDTGLPDLPENLFWRIIESYSKEFAYLLLMEREAVESGPRSTIARLFGGVVKPKVEVRELYREPLFSSSEEMADGAPFTVPAHELTPRLVRRVANKILAEYARDQEATRVEDERMAELEARRTDAEKWLGDFPPKSIPQE